MTKVQYKNCSVTPAGRTFSWPASQPEGRIQAGGWRHALQSNVAKHIYCYYFSWFSPRRCPSPQSARKMLARSTLMSADVQGGSLLSLFTLYTPNVRASGWNSLEENISIWMRSVALEQRLVDYSGFDDQNSATRILFPGVDLKPPQNSFWPQRLQLEPKRLHYSLHVSTASPNAQVPWALQALFYIRC